MANFPNPNHLGQYNQWLNFQAQLQQFNQSQPFLGPGSFVGMGAMPTFNTFPNFMQHTQNMMVRNNQYLSSPAHANNVIGLPNYGFSTPTQFQPNFGFDPYAGLNTLTLIPNCNSCGNCGNQINLGTQAVPVMSVHNNDLAQKCGAKIVSAMGTRNNDLAQSHPSHENLTTMAKTSNMCSNKYIPRAQCLLSPQSLNNGESSPIKQIERTAQHEFSQEKFDDVSKNRESSYDIDGNYAQETPQFTLMGNELNNRIVLSGQVLAENQHQSADNAYQSVKLMPSSNSTGMVLIAGLNHLNTTQMLENQQYLKSSSYSERSNMEKLREKSATTGNNKSNYSKFINNIDQNYGQTDLQIPPLQLMENELDSCNVLPEQIRTKSPPNIQNVTNQTHGVTAIRSTILCDVCESPFTTKSALTRHKKLKHSKIVKKFMCPICEQLFENRSNFKQHHQRKHADVVQPNEPAVVMVEAQEKAKRRNKHEN